MDYQIGDFKFIKLNRSSVLKAYEVKTIGRKYVQFKDLPNEYFAEKTGRLSNILQAKGFGPVGRIYNSETDWRADVHHSVLANFIEKRMRTLRFSDLTTEQLKDLALIAGLDLSEIND